MKRQENTTVPLVGTVYLVLIPYLVCVPSLENSGVKTCMPTGGHAVIPEIWHQQYLYASCFITNLAEHETLFCVCTKTLKCWEELVLEYITMRVMYNI